MLSDTQGYVKPPPDTLPPYKNDYFHAGQCRNDIGTGAFWVLNGPDVPSPLHTTPGAVYSVGMTETPGDTESLLRQNGAAIRALREMDGWTQQALAERTGFRQATISAAESEVSNATLITISKMARALRVPADAIMRDPGSAVRQNGTAIIALRTRHGWTQEGLARRTGLRKASISAIECESCSAYASTVAKITAALAVPAAAILRNPGTGRLARPAAEGKAA